MTQAKAQSVASNLIGQGYLVEVLNEAGVWKVSARTVDGTQVDVAAINTFATSNTVTASTARALFV